MSKSHFMKSMTYKSFRKLCFLLPRRRSCRLLDREWHGRDVILPCKLELASIAALG